MAMIIRSLAVATKSDAYAWTERMNDIRVRLSRRERLSQAEVGRLKNELDAIERFLKMRP